MSVEVTAFGLVLLAVALPLAVWRAAWLPGLLAVTAVLQAPAAFVVPIGDAQYGVTPFNVAAALVAAHLAWLVASRRRIDLGEGAARRAFALWSAFLAVSIVGALTLPLLFDGVEVHPLLSRRDVNAPTEPNRFGLAHVAQAINCVVVWVIFAWVLQLRERRRALDALLAGCALALGLALAIGIYQRLAMLGFVAMDPSFWGSNPGYLQFYDAREYGPAVGRVGLPFIEPSYASVWFATIAAAALAALLYVPARRGVAALVLAAAAAGLLNTIGTTGILAFAIFALAIAVLPLLPFGPRAPDGRRRTGLAMLGAFALFAAFAIYQVAWGTAPWLAGFRGSVAWTLLKFTDQVDQYRWTVTLQNLEVVRQTWGLGAGTGSARGSSWFGSLAANTGIPGLVLFVAALAVQAHALLRGARAGDVRAIYILGGTAGLVIGIAGGISDQNWPVLWVVLLAGFAWIGARAPPQP